jgi:hypothetical protein
MRNGKLKRHKHEFNIEAAWLVESGQNQAPTRSLGMVEQTPGN